MSTTTACVLIIIGCLTDSRRFTATYNKTSVTSLFLSFGIILFAFGGASTFPTIQHDMKRPEKFPRVVLISFSILLAMYLPVAAVGYWRYGHAVQNNIIMSLMTHSTVQTVTLVLITTHLLLAFVIILNPVAQELEHLAKVPTGKLLRVIHLHVLN